MNIKIPKKEYDKIIIDYLSGVGVLEMAQEYDVTYVTISNILKRNGFISTKRIKKGKRGKASVIPVASMPSIIRDYISGDRSSQEIADFYKVSKQRVQQILNEIGIKKIDDKRKKIQTKDELEVIQLFLKNGCKIKKTADLLGVGPTTVKRILENNNVLIPSQHCKLSSVQERDIIEQYRDGERVKNICSIYDISLPALYAILNKYEIKKRIKT